MAVFVLPAQRLLDNFANLTSQDKIKDYAKGSSLTDLVDLAERLSSSLEIVLNRQEKLNMFSEIKGSLAEAIKYKREYYQTHWLGKITQFVLRLFGLWNQGHTASIIKAEDFLLRYDLMLPLKKIDGVYQYTSFFWPLLTNQWIRENLDTREFFNYDPGRPIRFKANIVLDEVPPPFIQERELLNAQFIPQ